MTDLGIPGVGDATMIASGGSALVYEAVSGTGERLAVKVLRGVRGAEVGRRFDREQTATERLQGHPNIIRIHHSGLTAAGEPYLVMPLIPGGSLNDELESGGPFSLNQATADIALAADALEYAHQRGVLHRDIKPGNLLRSEDGSLIVSDFGIARVVDAGITSATVGASTPLYAAPEILSENKASVRSEVYSLGASLYALLAGRPAFAEGANIWATINRIRTEQPPIIDGVPNPVMRVILQAMAKDAVDRPPSAAHFRENLRMALTSPDDWVPPAQTIEIDRDATPAPASSTSSAATTAPVTPRPRTSSSAPAPPAPAFDRPTKAMGEAPTRDRFWSKALTVVAALALLIGVGLVIASRVLPADDLTDQTVQAPPVDNSLPAVDTSTDVDTDDSSEDTPPTNDAEPTESEDAGVAIEDLPDSELVPNTFVRFSGDHFTALLPEGWSLSGRDIQETYGFRSTFVANDAYLNIDTTPKEQREAGLDIGQSAQDIAAGIGSASDVRTEEIEGLTMHSFTFRNSQGVDSIDIFFEVDGDGYAVVAGSSADPDTAFATARLVALSVRSNPDQP